MGDLARRFPGDRKFWEDLGNGMKESLRDAVKRIPLAKASPTLSHVTAYSVEKERAST